jgi:hypothetical protein
MPVLDIMIVLQRMHELKKTIIVSETALTVDISYSSAFVIIHDDLSYIKVCARWVPQQPTEKHIQTLLWIL